MAPVPEPTASNSSSDAPAPSSTATTTQRPELTPDTLDFAAKMFDLARTGDLTLLQYLAAGLPPNLTNARGDSLLMLAAYHGQEDLVRAMLQQSTTAQAESASAQAPSGEAQQGQGQPHLEPHQRTDPNQLNAKSQSILAGTVFKSYPSIARLLVDAGADPLAGTPSAEETAKMFGKWDGEGGYAALFEGAPGRGRGGVEVGGQAPART